MKTSNKIIKRVSAFEAMELLNELFLSVNWETDRLNTGEKKQIADLIDIIETQNNYMFS